MLPHCWEVMGVKDHIEYLKKEGYRSLGKMLQGCLRNNVWVWRLGDIETLDDFVNLSRVG